MFILQEHPIQIEQAKQSYQDPKNGALVCFEGIVRRDLKNQGAVSALLYVAETDECQQEGARIIQEAKQLFPIHHTICIQRVGKINVGEPAIWIAVWAGHRDEAFLGCRYIIEEVKKRLLIWKKEFLNDGTSLWVHGAGSIDL